MLFYGCVLKKGEEMRSHESVLLSGKSGEDILDYAHGFPFEFTKNAGEKEGTENKRSKSHVCHPYESDLN